MECSALRYTVKKVSLSLQCKLTERKIAIIALCFQQTNSAVVLGRIRFTIHANDLQAIGISSCSQVHACLIIVI